MNFVPLALYVAALAAYWWHFSRRQPSVGRTATTLLVFAALAHTFVIGMRTMEIGHVPIISASSAISTFVWLLALGYLYTEMTTDERAMGAFVLPLLVAFQAISAFKPGTDEAAPPVLQGPLFSIHVMSLMLAYATLGLACMIGITYVLLFKEIKAKELGFFYARLPSLQVLDTMNQRAVILGWAFLTIGLVAGFIWTPQARAASGDPRVQAMSIADPTIFVSLVCWGVYSFEAWIARGMGWGGRKTAYLSALGFVIVLLNFVPISYFLTRSHNF
jgi:ABC-type transport system involved in cytochrome c biogenesis permease subunit